MKKKKHDKASKKKIQHTAKKPRIAQKASSIEFCDRCGSILIPFKKGSATIMKCRGCGRQSNKNIRGSLKIVEESEEKKKGVVVIEKDTTLLPLTDKTCPKCEHKKAYWWMQQTRSADEPPTQFFRCEKCKHTWREYK